jgi:hypothetical protein
MQEFPSLLIVALVLVFLAWRATVRRNRLVAAAREAQQEPNCYSLDAREGDSGRGFVVLDAEGSEVAGSTLSLEEHGLQVVEVRGFRPDADAGGSGDFAPGSAVELIPAEDATERMDVWNAAMTMRAGWLPAAGASDCLVLWEELRGGQRVGLQLLLVREDMQLDG